ALGQRPCKFQRARGYGNRRASRKINKRNINMPALAYGHLVEKIRSHAIALTGNAADYAPLLQMIGDARFVLIGEATHGTDEFYRMRAEITKQLILYCGFAA